MIERLEARTPADVERLGGKGCGLVRLLLADLPVPETWMLVADAPIDSAMLRESLETLCASQPTWSFAVRSSAVAEDHETASSAGIYRSELGLRGVAALEAAVCRCLASASGDHARAYRAARSPRASDRMAVLIQRQLDPVSAGVLLTVNPQRPFAHEIAIDAAWGLGERVASGRGDPDHWILDRESGAICHQRIACKRAALRPSPQGGVALRELPEARWREPSLDADRLASLFALARRAQASLGPSLDLEWAFEAGQCWLLQARPIVGLPSEQPNEVWTRRFGDEYMADYTTPCGYGFLVRWIADYTFHDVARRLRRRDLLDMEPLRRHRGYVYLSGLYVCGALRAVPRAARETALRGWFTPLWLHRVREEPFSLRLFLSSLLLPLRDGRATPTRNCAALARHTRRVRDELGGGEERGASVVSDAELAARLERVEALGREHFRIIRWGMGSYAPGFHAAARTALERLARDRDGELYAHLTSGLEGTRTGALNRDLWQLAERARADRVLLSTLRGTDGLDEVRSRSEGSAFWPAFDDFLRCHGHRGASREVSQPRWRETPESVLALLRAQVRSETPPASPAALDAAARERREAAWRRARDRMGRGVRGRMRALLVDWLCAQAREFTAYRENQRDTLDFILAELRVLLIEHGRRLVRAGVLAEAFEIFLLEPHTLRALLRQPMLDPSLRVRIEERRRHYERERHRLPASFLFDGIETEGEIVEGEGEGEGEGKGKGEGKGGWGGEGEGDGESAGKAVDEGAIGAAVGPGIGVSRGRAEGRARVLRALSELAQIESGEILVVANIDPGWTSVFPLLAGLVSETGGLLSHGALLAREYGIPAVMGVSAATQRITTGELIRIDGATGRLERT